jgi:hypothetical protein
MAAHNKDFPWMSYYGNYNFFESRMREHSEVNSIIKINASLYHIDRSDGTRIKAFICECYSFDVAEYIECCQGLGELDAIIISSNWCGYTFDVKRHCMSEQVGVYNIGGFMAALNMPNYWEYLTKYEKEKFKENGWI